MMVPFRARIPRPEDWPEPPKGQPAAPTKDGDTVRFEVDRYDDDSSLWDARLLGVFMPEMDEPGGVECREFVRRWLIAYSLPTVKWPFWLDSVPNRANPSKAVKSFERFICLISNVDRTHVLNHEVNLYRAENGWGGGVGA